MIEPFIVRALLAGLGVAVVAGVLGCFVVWRRMAYFGDSLAHGALLGVALGLLYGLPLHLGVAIAGVAFSVVLVWLQTKKILAMDALLGILAHAALSIGVVAVSIAERQLDLHAYLFGDILFVNATDLYWVGGGGLAVLALLAANWQALILTTVNEDIAVSEGVNVRRADLLLMLLMALTVAASIRIVGVLLISALLIIPAATARPFARSPAGMAVIAAACGAVAVLIGLSGSLQFDIPAGPAIVTAAALLFAGSLSYSLKRG